MRLPAIWLVLGVIGLFPIVALGDELASRDVDIQEIVASLEANDLSANEIREIASYARLDIVDLRAFEASDDYEALETALDRTDDGWAMVQTAIVANEPLNEELKRRSIAVRRVVAATLDDKDVLTILTR